MDLKSSFNDLGYCEFDPNHNINTLNKSKAIFRKILKKCENGLYKKIRVYDDYLLKINVSGIENVFDKEIIDQEILDLISNSNIINIAKSILEEEEIILTLSRYHVTNDITHCGIWHRDGKPNELESVQVNLYLLDETGMEIISKSHLRNNYDYEDEVLNLKPYSNLLNSKKISVTAGKVLAFNPSLIHRGKSLKRRAHLHFRFTKKKNLTKKADKSFSLDFLDNYSIDSNLKNLLIKSAEYGYIYETEDYNNNSKLKKNILRIIRFFIHKFLFFLNYDNKLYQKFNVRPCLSMRKIFNLD